MRRLSVYYNGGEAVTYVMEPEDALDFTEEEFLTINKGKGLERIWINRSAIMYFRLFTYDVEVKEGGVELPKVAPTPSIDLI